MFEFWFHEEPFYAVMFCGIASLLLGVIVLAVT